ncbi:DUF6587 family protein [Xanthomonas translucens]|uniref:DUF6587 family protein n=1 Tax=Xanthomonas campestris pv. translucens TaxID=343 RepID=UPI0002A788C0|nr:DUF6587 family protein [Xanthomonas translucens]AKK67410.1 hypothetical protein FD63_07930 [Xanthomonas translucens pv. undulosa]AVY67106.1 hypothetical protein NZ30_12475 [Xanthomonas translucens pv. undulosa]ELQ00652.1 hypothetical protein A989_16743 [Xanthomonas translucens DAR61454]MBC3973963.1 hypothetical protein [Xanthomonas translucens pv. undulosa]MCT8270923.1 hypothetical protein [Xanthomonas translucens pv. undulosa]
MSTSLLLQYLVIALAVLLSAWVVLKKQFPGTARTLRSAIALRLLKPGRATWLQALGRKIAPAASAGGGACGGCDSCGPTPPQRH